MLQPPFLQFPLLPPLLPARRLLVRNRTDATATFFALPFSVLVLYVHVYCVRLLCAFVSRDEFREQKFSTTVQNDSRRFVRARYCSWEAEGIASGVMTVGVGTPASENEFKITKSTRGFMARPSAVSFEAVG
jgi:hypothetical protein